MSACVIPWFMDDCSSLRIRVEWLESCAALWCFSCLLPEVLGDHHRSDCLLLDLKLVLTGGESFVHN